MASDPRPCVVEGCRFPVQPERHMDYDACARAGGCLVDYHEHDHPYQPPAEPREGEAGIGRLIAVLVAYGTGRGDLLTGQAIAAVEQLRALSADNERLLWAQSLLADERDRLRAVIAEIENAAENYQRLMHETPMRAHKRAVDALSDIRDILERSRQ